jgi:hypothetical protein
MPGELVPDWEPDGNGKAVPAKITIADFRRYFSASFPKLVAEEHDGLIQDAIDTVYAIFTGVNTIWDMHPDTVWYEKSQVCYRLLTAWYIADRYPEMSAAYASIDGLPLKRRKVDGVDLTVATELLEDASAQTQGALNDLKSNGFGRKALLMIRASAKRAMLRNWRRG